VSRGFMIDEGMIQVSGRGAGKLCVCERDTTAGGKLGGSGENRPAWSPRRVEVGRVETETIQPDGEVNPASGNHVTLPRIRCLSCLSIGTYAVGRSQRPSPASEIASR
jgi:hypothetical protein